MAIDTQTVKRIAFLSRLRIEDDKIQATEDEFNKILDWVEQLKEVNTDNVEPLISVNELFSHGISSEMSSSLIRLQFPDKQITLPSEVI